MAEPLERQIEQLQQENMRLRQECERNRRQELMEHLLCGEYSSAQGIRSDLRGVGIRLDRDSFIELYVNVLEEPPKPIQTKDGGFAPPEDFRQRFEDGLGQLIQEIYPDYYCAACRWGAGVAALLQMERTMQRPLPTGNFIDDLNLRALQLIDQINSQSGLDVFISISRPHTGIEGIAQAHREIERIKNYRYVMDFDVPVLCYHDFELADEERKNDPSAIRLEQKYLSYVELGRYDQAQECLLEMIELEFRHGIPPLHAFEMKLFARLDLLLMSVQRLFPEYDAPFYESILQLNQAVSEYRLTISEIEARIRAIFSDLIHFAAQQQSPKWLPEVLKYVEESCTNAELNVALIAETFGLNPSYLSREVKHVTGSSLLDLLQKKRLEHAVALLGQGKTMIQSAQESGFGNDRAMRRAMKKYQTDAE